MSIASEFKQFIMRGNVIDLAVGMVVGTAFSGIVKSLVDDVIMPPIGLLIGGVDFSNLFITLKDGAQASISTGVYHFPADLAAETALAILKKTLPQCPTVEKIVFCCFSPQDAQRYRALLERDGVVV